MNNLRSNYFLIFFFFTYLTWSQTFSEKIIFTSSNPYSFSEIISNSEVQKQDVFGQLVVPTDTLNPNKKYPLIIGVAGSEGWKNHHYDYLKMYQYLCQQSC